MSSSQSVTPLSPPTSSTAIPSVSSTPPEPPLIAVVGEQLDVDYQVHELPVAEKHDNAIPELSVQSTTTEQNSDIVNAALLARIEILESENAELKRRAGKDKVHLCMENIKDDDRLVSFYTGFKSYVVFLAFFQFLGPAVDKLNYWGSKSVTPQRK